MPKELEDLVELPEQFTYIWQDFIQLNNKRTSNGFGVNPITWIELKSYYDLIQYVPNQIELDILGKLDQIAMKAYAKQAEQQSKVKSRK